MPCHPRYPACQHQVSNSPCGVESSGSVMTSAPVDMFLIHRVELKEYFAGRANPSDKGF